MTLIKSISGMRGTIGGKPGDNLTPIDLAEFAGAFGQKLRQTKDRPKVVVGRDGRMSGENVKHIVIRTLLMMGVDVVDGDLSTTPSIEMAVTFHHADGGIIITASHNPKHWNALKFLNEKGEFISGDEGEAILKTIAKKDYSFAKVDEMGTLTFDTETVSRHIANILKSPYVDADLIRSKKFNIIIDGINSTGATSVPMLLKELNCTYTVINEVVNGDFAHNPEPLPKHLSELSRVVLDTNADLGIAVDPDVDRLAFVSENGIAFGEEYTLVAAADHMLSFKARPTVSNLSSSRALTDISNKYGVDHYRSAVGEVHVVNKMKEVGSVIGGEGNGGIILPSLHNGRDALAGTALILTLLAKRDISMSALRAGYTDYYMSKDKVDLDPNLDLDNILVQIRKNYASENCLTIDGLKIDFKEEWVHLRKSNTEPIIRIYAEAKTMEKAQALTEKFKEELVLLSN